VKFGNGELRADSYNILKSWKNYFSHLLHAQSVSEVRQTEIHTAEPLLPDPSPFQVETVNTKLKKYIDHQVVIKFRQN
jgi:hypothetical protein